MKNTNKKNLIIAEFMQKGSEGFGLYDYNGKYYKLDELKFHTSWDWLIPVAQMFTDSIIIFKIDVTYNLVLEYIKEYNQNK